MVRIHAGEPNLVFPKKRSSVVGSTHPAPGPLFSAALLAPAVHLAGSPKLTWNRLHFRIGPAHIVHQADGSAFQVHVEERMHVVCSNPESTARIQRATSVTRIARPLIRRLKTVRDCLPGMEGSAVRLNIRFIIRKALYNVKYST